MLTPKTPEELAEAMGSAGSRKQTVTLGGGFSKRLMAGPVVPADVTVSTSALNRVLKYEPGDLTVSVEAGVTYCELSRVLAEHRQMIPLDPPYADAATIGGVVAANCSGPRRRLYGTARDMVIGMKFATLDGRLAQSGGMVVKNVAGLDMAKLLIGSFGTLAAIAVVNFKVIPQPGHERSFLLSFAGLNEAMEARGAILKSVLQPAALDLLNAQAAAEIGAEGCALAVQVGGNAAVVDRYENELAGLGSVKVLQGAEQAALWSGIQNYTPRYLAAHPEGAVVRVAATLKGIGEVMASLAGPAVARAASGVCYGHFPGAAQAAEWTAEAVQRGWKAVIEFAPEAGKASLELWPSPGVDFELMKRVKHMFDPDNLLNRGRLYGRI